MTPKTSDDLRGIRRRIDDVDRSLVELIGERLALALAAADAKGGTGREMRDLRREAEVIRQASEWARDVGLDPELVRDVFWRLIELSHRTRASRGEKGAP